MEQFVPTVVMVVMVEMVQEALILDLDKPLQQPEEQEQQVQ